MKYFIILTIISLFLTDAAFASGDRNSREQESSADHMYLDSPLFFELFREYESVRENLNLLPNGNILLPPLDLLDVSGFDWTNKVIKSRTHLSRLEDFRYLLPFINSSDPQHWDFAKKWFETWFEVHKEETSPNIMAWDFMTTAIRGMVLMVFLKQAETRKDRDEQLIRQLEESILSHQVLLFVQANFDLNNHGLWEIVGLMEVARLSGDESCVILSLDRLERLLSVSVSNQGIHFEHSPKYHFYFLSVLTKCVEYFDSRGLDSISQVGLAKDCLNKMREGSYFLIDHSGQVPPIGDSFLEKIQKEVGRRIVDIDKNYCFDIESGFAVFKDKPESPFRRYIVFKIQADSRRLYDHYHFDGLSVYYSDDGEIILGDQGSYTYDSSESRTYFRSHFAHNTFYIPGKYDTYHVTSPWCRDDDENGCMGATLNLKGNVFERELSIPGDEHVFTVQDTIRNSGGIVQLWNIGPDVVDILPVRASPESTTMFEWILETKRERRFILSITLAGSFNPAWQRVQIVRGGTDPLLGWYSPKWEKMVPSSVIKMEWMADGVMVVKSHLRKLD